MAKEVQTPETTATLADFTFDDSNTFFGIKTEGDTTEQIIKEVKGAEKIVADGSGTKTPEATKIEEEEAEEELTFFETEEEKAKKEAAKKKDEEEEEAEEEEEVEEVKEKGKKDKEEKPEDKEEGDDKFYTTLASELKEKGIFQNIELKEGEEVTEEKFFELQDAEVEARVEETFQAFFEELDEDGKRFLKFKKDGGKTADFFASFNTPEVDLTEFDVDDEEQRTKVLVHYLTKVEKLEPEDLKDRLAWLKEGGKEKSYAKKYAEAMEAESQAIQEQLLKRQAKAAKDKEESAKVFGESLKATLEKTETVGVFSFTPADQKELAAYITKPSVKIGKNKYIPAFQAEIAEIFKAEDEESQKKLLLLAKLVKTKFDTKDLATETKTKVVSKVKSKLKEAKTGVKPASAGGFAKRSISDFFDEE